MAKPSTREILLGGFGYFIEVGTTVDAQTVSHLIKPDTSPLANWTDNSLGTILEFKRVVEETDTSYMAPSPSGGYGKVPRKSVIADSYVMKLRDMNEIVMRLESGVQSAIALGTAQTPGAQADRKIEGWLKLQGRAEDGYDLYVEDWWCQVRLDGSNTFNEKHVTPSLKFTLLKAVNGAAVPGNSIVWPVES
jgi:hypothetical protein